MKRCSGNFTFNKKFNPNVYVDIKKFLKEKSLHLEIIKMR